MKKKLLLFVAIMIIVGCCLLGACTEGVSEVEKIVVTGMPVTTYYVGDGFDYNDAKLTVYYENGNVEVVSLEPSMISDFDSQKEGEQVLSVTYGGATAYISVTVSKAPLYSIAMEEGYKDVYVEGQPLDTTDMYIVATYTNGYTEMLQVTEDMISNFDTDIVANRQCIVTYLDKTVRCDYSVVEKSILRIGVRNPDKRNYVVGQKLDLKGSQLFIAYNNNTVEYINILDKNGEIFDKDAVKILISGNETDVFERAGNIIYVSVEYMGYEASFFVSVDEISAKDIKMIGRIKDQPRNSPSVDFSGCYMQVRYNNDDVKNFKIAPDDYDYKDVVFSHPDEEAFEIIYKNFDLTKDGTYNIAIKMEGLVYEAAITVVPPVEKTLHIDIGDRVYYQGGKDIDITQWQYSVEMTNGSYLIFNSADNKIVENVTLAMLDAKESNSDFGLESAGEKVFHFVFLSADGRNTCKATVKVPVVAKKVEDDPIEFIAPARKYYQINENLIINDGSLTVGYNDGTTKEVELTYDMIEGGIEGLTSSVGEKEIKFVYKDPKYPEGECRFAYTICVIKVATSLSLGMNGVKTKYVLGESFDSTGLVIYINYSDGVTDSASVFTGDEWIFENTDLDAVGNTYVRVYYGDKSHGVYKDIDVIVTNNIVSVEFAEEFVDFGTVTQGLDIVFGEDAYLVVTRENGTVENVKITADMLDYKKNDHTTGIRPVKVTYTVSPIERWTFTKNVNIVAGKIADIEIIGSPTYIAYTVDDKEGTKTVINAKLDGLVVKVVYDNGMEVRLSESNLINPTTTDDSDITVYVLSDLNLTVGISKVDLNLDANAIYKRQKVVVNVLDTASDTSDSVDYVVYCYKDSVKSISFLLKNSNTNRIEDVYERYDLVLPDDACIVITYAEGSDGTSETETVYINELDKTEYTISGYDPNQAGEQTVTISYLQKECNFIVNVLGKKIKGIVALNDTVYVKEGMNITTNDIKLQLYYVRNDGRDYEPQYRPSISFNNVNCDFDPSSIVFSDGEKQRVIENCKISYVYEGELVETSVKVIVSRKKAIGLTMQQYPQSTYIENSGKGTPQKLNYDGGYVMVAYDNDTYEQLELNKNIVGLSIDDSGFDCSELEDGQKSRLCEIVINFQDNLGNTVSTSYFVTIKDRAYITATFKATSYVYDYGTLRDKHIPDFELSGYRTFDGAPIVLVNSDNFESSNTFEKYTIKFIDIDKQPITGDWPKDAGLYRMVIEYPGDDVNNAFYSQDISIQIVPKQIAVKAKDITFTYGSVYNTESIGFDYTLSKYQFSGGIVSYPTGNALVYSDENPEDILSIGYIIKKEGSDGEEKEVQLAQVDGKYVINIPQGKYLLIPTLLEMKTKNYEVKIFNSAELIVNRKDIAIVASDHSKIYGTPDMHYEYTVYEYNTDTQEYDTVIGGYYTDGNGTVLCPGIITLYKSLSGNDDVIENIYDYELERVTGNDVGNYAIKQGAAKYISNYNLNYEKDGNTYTRFTQGSLTINKKDIVINVRQCKERSYGQKSDIFDEFWENEYAFEIADGYSMALADSFEYVLADLLNYRKGYFEGKLKISVYDVNNNWYYFAPDVRAPAGLYKIKIEVNENIEDCIAPNYHVIIRGADGEEGWGGYYLRETFSSTNVADGTSTVNVLYDESNPFAVINGDFGDASDIPVDFQVLSPEIADAFDLLGERYDDLLSSYDFIDGILSFTNAYTPFYETATALFKASYMSLPQNVGANPERSIMVGITQPYLIKSAGDSDLGINDLRSIVARLFGFDSLSSFETCAQTLAACFFETGYGDLVSAFGNSVIYCTGAKRVFPFAIKNGLETPVLMYVIVCYDGVSVWINDVSVAVAASRYLAEEPGEITNKLYGRNVLFSNGPDTFVFEISKRNVTVEVPSDFIIYSPGNVDKNEVDGDCYEYYSNGWCSETHETEISEYGGTTVKTVYDDCNPFGMFAGHFGAISSLSQHKSPGVADSIVADFNDLSHLFAVFIGHYGTIDDEAEYNINYNYLIYWDYLEFYNKALSVYDNALAAIFTNKYYDESAVIGYYDESAVIGINKRYVMTFGMHEDMHIDDYQKLVANLFGFANQSDFAGYAQSLADAYNQYRNRIDNPLPEDAALANGCFYTDNGTFIFPVLIKNSINGDVLTHIIVDPTGIVSVWINDVNSALWQMSFDSEHYNSFFMGKTNELYCKDRLFVEKFSFDFGADYAISEVGYPSVVIKKVAGESVGKYELKFSEETLSNSNYIFNFKGKFKADLEKYIIDNGLSDVQESIFENVSWGQEKSKAYVVVLPAELTVYYGVSEEYDKKYKNAELIPADFEYFADGKKLDDELIEKAFSFRYEHQTVSLNSLNYYSAGTYESMMTYDYFKDGNNKNYIVGASVAINPTMSFGELPIYASKENKAAILAYAVFGVKKPSAIVFTEKFYYQITPKVLDIEITNTDFNYTGVVDGSGVILSDDYIKKIKGGDDVPVNYSIIAQYFDPESPSGYTEERVSESILNSGKYTISLTGLGNSNYILSEASLTAQCIIEVRPIELKVQIAIDDEEDIKMEKVEGVGGNVWNIYDDYTGVLKNRVFDNSWVETNEIEWCSGLYEAEVSGYVGTKVQVLYDDCNPFGMIAGKFGEMASLSKHTTQSAATATIAAFNSLGELFASFMGKFTIPADGTEYVQNVNDATILANYTEFYNKAIEIYNGSLVSFTHNVSNNLDASMVIGLNKPYMMTFGSSAGLQIADAQTVIARLFGFEYCSELVGYAQSLANTYTQYRNRIDNPLPADAALENGCFRTLNNYFVFPIAVKNNLSFTVLTYVIVDTEGRVSVWINDITAARWATNCHSNYTDDEITNELCCKNMLFIESAVDKYGYYYTITHKIVNRTSLAAIPSNLIIEPYYMTADNVAATPLNAGTYDIRYIINADYKNYTVVFVSPGEKKGEYEECTYRYVVRPLTVNILNLSDSGANVMLYDGVSQPEIKNRGNIIINGYVAADPITPNDLEFTFVRDMDRVPEALKSLITEDDMVSAGYFKIQVTTSKSTNYEFVLGEESKYFIIERRPVEIMLNGRVALSKEYDSYAPTAELSDLTMSPEMEYIYDDVYFELLLKKYRKTSSDQWQNIPDTIWCSEKYETYISGYDGTRVNVMYDDCNPFGMIAGKFGAIASLSKHETESIAASTIAAFNSLGELFASFMGKFTIPADGTEYVQNVNDAAILENYTEFYNRAMDIYNRSIVSFTHNVSNNLDVSMVIGLNRPYMMTFGSSAGLQIADAQTVIARLFGFENLSEFVGYAQSLANTYAAYRNRIDNPLPADAALENGCFRTGNDYFVFPIAVKNELSSTVLTYVIVDTNGRVSVWINDITAALWATDFNSSHHTNSIINNELLCKNILFITEPGRYDVGQYSYDIATYFMVNGQKIYSSTVIDQIRMYETVEEYKQYNILSWNYYYYYSDLFTNDSGDEGIYTVYEKEVSIRFDNGVQELMTENGFPIDYYNYYHTYGKHAVSMYMAREYINGGTSASGDDRFGNYWLVDRRGNVISEDEVAILGFTKYALEIFSLNNIPDDYIFNAGDSFGVNIDKVVNGNGNFIIKNQNMKYIMKKLPVKLSVEFLMGDQSDAVPETIFGTQYPVSDMVAAITTTEGTRWQFEFYDEEERDAFIAALELGMCSEGHKVSFVGYDENIVELTYDDCNPFIGIYDPQRHEGNISDSTIADFNSLSESFAAFMGNFEIPTDGTEYMPTIDDAARASYTAFYKKAMRIYSGSLVLYKHNANDIFAESAIIGLNKPYMMTFGSSADLQIADAQAAVAKLFGFKVVNLSDFVDYAQNLADTYAAYRNRIDNPLPADAALENGCFYTDGSFVFPFVIKNDLTPAILIYVIIDSDGLVSAWINDIPSALRAVNYNENYHTGQEITNKLYCKNMLFYALIGTDDTDATKNKDLFILYSDAHRYELVDEDGIRYSIENLEEIPSGTYTIYVSGMDATKNYDIEVVGKTFVILPRSINLLEAQRDYYSTDFAVKRYEINGEQKEYDASNGDKTIEEIFLEKVIGTFRDYDGCDIDSVAGTGYYAYALGYAIKAVANDEQYKEQFKNYEIKINGKTLGKFNDAEALTLPLTINKVKVGVSVVNSVEEPLSFEYADLVESQVYFKYEGFPNIDCTDVKNNIKSKIDIGRLLQKLNTSNVGEYKSEDNVIRLENYLIEGITEITENNFIIDLSAGSSYFVNKRTINLKIINEYSPSGNSVTSDDIYILAGEEESLVYSETTNGRLDFRFEIKNPDRIVGYNPGSPYTTQQLLAMIWAQSNNGTIPDDYASKISCSITQNGSSTLVYGKPCQAVIDTTGISSLWLSPYNYTFICEPINVKYYPVVEGIGENNSEVTFTSISVGSGSPQDIYRAIANKNFGMYVDVIYKGMGEGKTSVKMDIAKPIGGYEGIPYSASWTVEFVDGNLDEVHIGDFVKLRLAFNESFFNGGSKAIVSEEFWVRICERGDKTVKTKSDFNKFVYNFGGANSSVNDFNAAKETNGTYYLSEDETTPYAGLFDCIDTEVAIMPLASAAGNSKFSIILFDDGESRLVLSFGSKSDYGYTVKIIKNSDNSVLATSEVLKKYPIIVDGEEEDRDVLADVNMFDGRKHKIAIYFNKVGYMDYSTARKDPTDEEKTICDHKIKVVFVIDNMFVHELSVKDGERTRRETSEPDPNDANNEIISTNFEYLTQFLKFTQIVNYTNAKGNAAKRIVSANGRAGIYIEECSAYVGKFTLKNMGVNYNTSNYEVLDLKLLPIEAGTILYAESLDAVEKMLQAKTLNSVYGYEGAKITITKKEYLPDVLLHRVTVSLNYGSNRIGSDIEFFVCIVPKASILLKNNMLEEDNTFGVYADNPVTISSDRSGVEIISNTEQKSIVYSKIRFSYTSLRDGSNLQFFFKTKKNKNVSFVDNLVMEIDFSRIDDHEYGKFEASVSLGNKGQSWNKQVGVVDLTGENIIEMRYDHINTTIWIKLLGIDSSGNTFIKLETKIYKDFISGSIGEVAIKNIMGTPGEELNRGYCGFYIFDGTITLYEYLLGENYNGVLNLIDIEKGNITGVGPQVTDIDSINSDAHFGWCSEKYKTYISGYDGTRVNVIYDDCNPFGMIAGKFGAIANLSQHTTQSAADSTIAAFNSLGELFAAFMGNFEIPTDGTEYAEIVDDAEILANYTAFYNRAMDIYNSSLVSFTHNVSNNLTGSAVIGLNKPYMMTFGSSADLQITDAQTVMAKLFGFENLSDFVGYAQSLANTYAAYRNRIDNPLPADAALENGCFRTLNNYFVFPIAVKNELSSTVLTYVIVDTDGRVSVWINDIAAALWATNFNSSYHTDSTINNELLCKNILFITEPHSVWLADSYGMPMVTSTQNTYLEFTLKDNNSSFDLLFANTTPYFFGTDFDSENMSRERGAILTINNNGIFVSFYKYQTRWDGWQIQTLTGLSEMNIDLYDGRSHKLVLMMTNEQYVENPGTPLEITYYKLSLIIDGVEIPQNDQIRIDNSYSDDFSGLVVIKENDGSKLWVDGGTRTDEETLYQSCDSYFIPHTRYVGIAPTAGEISIEEFFVF